MLLKILKTLLFSLLFGVLCSEKCDILRHYSVLNEDFMEHEFWHNKWKANEIGFHKDETNAFLKGNLQSLDLNPGATILVPLCGKTLDIAYLLSSGHKVVAAELNESAIIQLFENMEVTPKVTDLGSLKQYQAPKKSSTMKYPHY